MASLDIARAYAEDILKTNRTADIEKELINMREVFSQINGADIVEPADARIRQDPLKLCIRSAYGHSGFELKSIFEANGIHPELADERQVLLILPLEGKNMPAPELISTISKDMKIQQFEMIFLPESESLLKKSRLCLTGKASCLPSKKNRCLLPKQRAE
jgi:arginine decarboxylase